MHASGTRAANWHTDKGERVLLQPGAALPSAAAQRSCAGARALGSGHAKTLWVRPGADLPKGAKFVMALLAWHPLRTRSFSRLALQSPWGEGKPWLDPEAGAGAVPLGGSRLLLGRAGHALVFWTPSACREAGASDFFD